MEDNAVNNDHPLDDAQQTLMSPTKHEPESRIQDHRLACHHEAPSDGVDGNAEGKMAELEVLDHET